MHAHQYEAFSTSGFTKASCLSKLTIFKLLKRNGSTTRIPRMCECSNLAAIRPVGNGASSQAAAAAERLDGAAAKRKATHRLVEST